MFLALLKPFMVNLSLSDELEGSFLVSVLLLQKTVKVA